MVPKQRFDGEIGDAKMAPEARINSDGLKKIKADPAIAHIPVIIMSNFSRPEDISWGEKLGAAKFVEKVSIVPGDIADIVHNAIHEAQ